MRVTQGTFSFLPDLTDAQIRAQIEYCLGQGWAVSIEHTDDPHPRNVYWEMHGNPMFDLKDAAGVMAEVEACRRAFPSDYVKVNAFDSSHGWESLRLSFLVNRPEREPRFALDRQESTGRMVRYTTRVAASGEMKGPAA
jgi:ribulose-bisphosphate carboxylase small chain